MPDPSKRITRQQLDIHAQAASMPDRVAEQRVATWAACLGAGFVLSLLTYYPLVLALHGFQWAYVAHMLLAAIVGGLSAWVFWRARDLAWSLERLRPWALGLQGTAAAVVTVSAYGQPPEPLFQGMVGLPPVSLLILLFPALVVGPPKWHGLIAGGIVVLLPVYNGLRAIAGFPHYDVQSLLLFLVPALVVGVLAVLLAMVTWRTEAQLEHAEQTARDLGSYQLERRLGEGGMGEVWLARHRMLARPAAIKLIHTSALAGTPERLERLLQRFEREAQATARLCSRHTVELYDYGRTDDGRFYYVMELLDGIDLEQLVRDHGPQPPARVIHILRSVAQSLSEAHTRGIIHRDVKPANLFVCRYVDEVDVVKVLDFGLVAQQPDRATPIAQEAVTASEPPPQRASDPVPGGDIDATRLTAFDQLPGTPAFMAPEVALREAHVDHRSDLYAVGCIGYWLLTGRYVFTGDSAMKVIVQHIRQPPEPPSTHTTEPVPAQLEAIIMRCLAKQPADRPDSARELADRLRCAQHGHEWTEDHRQAWWDDHLTEHVRSTIILPDKR